MGKIIIPDDYDPDVDGTCQMRVTVPKSPKWRGTLIGQLADLSHAGTWDGSTGDVDQAIQIVVDMLESIAYQAC